MDEGLVKVDLQSLIYLFVYATFSFMSRSFLIIILFSASFTFFACSDKYKPFKGHYNFKSPDGRPDYSDLHYWAAHPWKWDPSDSVPKPLRNEIRDSAVDVFFCILPVTP